MNKKEWLKRRQKGITATGAAAILGISPYMTNIDYWELKTGRKAEDDISGNPYVQYGLEAEKHLIELFRLDYPEYELIHKDYDLRVHPEHDFLIGSLDGELIAKNSLKHGLFEAKTVEIFNKTQAQVWQNGIPDQYFYQCLHNLIVNPEFEFVVLKAQLKRVAKKDGPFKDVSLETKHYYFERDQVKEHLDHLIKKELYFWRENVLKDVQPGLILPII